AIGTKARTSRSDIDATVSDRLVPQISRRNGGMLRIAPKRWRMFSCCWGRGGGIGRPGKGATGLQIPRSPSRQQTETATASKQGDLIQSVADALQYISYHHPIDYIRRLAAAGEREEPTAAKDAMGQILTNSRM